MPASDNFECTLEFVAPAGGVTAGTMVFVTANRNLILPMTTATSGNTYTGKVMGKVTGIAVTATQAMVAGTPLAWNTTNTLLAAIASGTTANAQAIAATAIAASASTTDVILIFPQAVVTP